MDIHAPKHEQDYFSHYPLAPEKKSIPSSALSPYQREILKDQFGEKRKTIPTDEELEWKVDEHKSGEKLLLDFETRTKYIIHYRNLQLYLKLGMKITRIRRVLSFNQNESAKTLALDFIQNKAVFHKNCVSNYNKQKYDRKLKQKCVSTVEPETPETPRTS